MVSGNKAQMGLHVKEVILNEPVTPGTVKFDTYSQWVCTVRVYNFSHENRGRTSETFGRTDQDGIDVKIDVNGKVLLSARDFNIRKILMSKVNQVEGEVADIEGRGTYHRSWVEVGIDLTPLYWHRGAWG